MIECLGDVKDKVGVERNERLRGEGNYLFESIVLNKLSGVDGIDGGDVQWRG